LIFDFGTNEEAAQQARHKVDGWKQGFRLGNKMLLKFEREDSAEKEEDGDDESKPGDAKGKKKSAAKKENEKASEPVRLFLRLDFSDHEKISHQRWLDRIPTEEPFKSAASETVRQGDAEFAKTSELFESLD
jgi:hypothetical protein